MWIDDFIECFDVTDNKDLQIDRGYALKNAYIPDKLFKFRGVNDFSLNNLAAETVWLNTPSYYNDPYDSVASISTQEIQNTALRSRMKSIPELDKLYELIPQEEIERISKLSNPMREINRKVLESHAEIPAEKIPGMLDALEAMFQEVLAPAYTQLLDHIRSSLKICSFAATMSPITMWSHYGDQHKGICIEYNMTGVHKDDLRRQMLFPVIYKEKMFDCTKYHVSAVGNRDGFNNIYAILQALFKSPEWTYENEWRLIFSGGVFKTECNWPWLPASTVYLGAKISAVDQEKVVRICRSRNIPVMKMRVKPDRFELEAETIEEDDAKSVSSAS